MRLVERFVEQTRYIEARDKILAFQDFSDPVGAIVNEVALPLLHLQYPTVEYIDFLVHKKRDLTLAAEVCRRGDEMDINDPAKNAEHNQILRHYYQNTYKFVFEAVCLGLYSKDNYNIESPIDLSILRRQAAVLTLGYLLDRGVSFGSDKDRYPKYREDVIAQFLDEYTRSEEPTDFGRVMKLRLMDQQLSKTPVETIPMGLLADLSLDNCLDLKGSRESINKVMAFIEQFYPLRSWFSPETVSKFARVNAHLIDFNNVEVKDQVRKLFNAIRLEVNAVLGPYLPDKLTDRDLDEQMQVLLAQGDYGLQGIIIDNAQVLAEPVKALLKELLVISQEKGMHTPIILAQIDHTAIKDNGRIVLSYQGNSVPLSGKALTPLLYGEEVEAKTKKKTPQKRQVTEEVLSQRVFEEAVKRVELLYHQEIAREIDRCRKLYYRMSDYDGKKNATIFREILLPVLAKKYVVIQVETDDSVYNFDKDGKDFMNWYKQLYQAVRDSQAVANLSLLDKFFQPQNKTVFDSDEFRLNFEYGDDPLNSLLNTLREESKKPILLFFTSNSFHSRQRNYMPKLIEAYEKQLDLRILRKLAKTKRRHLMFVI